MIAAFVAVMLAMDGNCPPPLTLPAGLAIPLVTLAPLSSKTAHTGDPIDLVTSDDVVVDGTIAIPKGSAAHGQVAEARSTGGLGVNGKLTLRPLYLTLGDTTVRLTGSTIAKREVPAGTAIGMVTLTPVLSGATATVGAQTVIPAAVLKTVMIAQCPKPN
ncbi:hypothetical protein [Sphingomonas psychrolutea]|uniref:Uncharacterized protein n=1 Tax=Sphingomonas psychrolutea TaxID=1259676 RepID=A0ABQ1GE18_9SPHN|nr:hypothetical protein [Sphingomonas psychrolutea]GGA41923.1 hypothetical protein GCM10011395_10290 [Sphingomonas psychrolutea]